MIEWKLIALDSDKEEVILDLMVSPSPDYLLKETDFIKFQISVDNDSYIKLGEPYILLGDVPLEVDFDHNHGDYRVFISREALGNSNSRFLYNFFGESEIGLAFKDEHGFIVKNRINILARTENANLANEMLSYITDNFEDAVSICFSRSKVSGDHDLNDSFNFTRLEIVEKTINYLTANLALFTREHNHTWKTEILLTEQGLPTGPDSVYWVLSNLDRISPANNCDSNIIYHNRYYRIDPLPKERVLNDSDVYENRVLHTFLHEISLFLIEIRKQYSYVCSTNENAIDSSYVRFDHTMQKFTQLVLLHKTRSLNRLLINVEQIRRVILSKLPARIIPSIQPRMTAYVYKNKHYLKAFQLIEQCNLAPAPTFEGRKILFGLKNLAIVYEISSLLMLHSAIQRCFLGVKVEKGYRFHREGIPFGGQEKERKYGEINNYFSYRSEEFDIELFYEPKIFPFSSVSSVDDLVDTSNTRFNSLHGTHYFCPDFVLIIRSSRWRSSVTLIMDAKYKDAETIRKYDMAFLTQKYLLNIHKVKKSGNLGMSPVHLLLILFAHSGSGSYVRTVAPRHCLIGELPVLPQAAAILLQPNDSSKLDQHLKAIVNYMDKESI